MTSNDIKTAFAAAGIKVRVKSLVRNFRICTVDGSAHSDNSQSIAASLGMTAANGRPGGSINQAHEMFAYAPGFVRIVG